jgi:hypothetical protein
MTICVRAVSANGVSRVDPGRVVRARDTIHRRDRHLRSRQTKVLTKDEARRVAVHIARLPELLGKAD